MDLHLIRSHLPPDQRAASELKYPRRPPRTSGVHVVPRIGTLLQIPTAREGKGHPDEPDRVQLNVVETCASLAQPPMGDASGEKARSTFSRYGRRRRRCFGELSRLAEALLGGGTCDEL